MNESWMQRWQEGRIGWHETSGNASLRKYWRGRGKRVLVPLCGKSVDLLWLESRGNSVCGVELSDIAVRAFFDENGLAYSLRDGELPAYVAEGRNVTIYCGDFFEFRHPGFDALYDRGALVALDPDSRPAYARQLHALLEPRSEKLIITLEYDDAIAAGPPFSVPREELLSYWPGLEQVDRYDDIDNGPPKFREAGLRQMFEVVWR